MVLFGVNLWKTNWWWPGGHFHTDRGAYIPPKEGAGADTLAAGTHTGYVKVDPVGGVDGWDFAFSGAPGNVNGDATSPTTLNADNIACNFQPAAPTLQSAVSLSLKPVGAPAQKFRQEFLDLAKYFKSGLRVMDLCGVGADYVTALDPAGAGSWSHVRRACPNIAALEADAATPVYTWDSEGTHSPDKLAELNDITEEIWVNVPPFLAAAEQAVFLSQFAGFRRIWCAYSNEVWNGRTVMGQYSVDRAVIENLNPDRWVGQAVWYVRKALALKAVADSLGPQFRTVLEWWAEPGGYYPFSAPAWNGYRPVNQECYDAVQTVGHVAIAPYFYGDSNTAVDAALDRLKEWRDGVRSRGAIVHCYECGQHDLGPKVNQTTAAKLAAWDRYLRGLAREMDSGASAFVYALAGAWSDNGDGSWGLVEKFGTSTTKWTTVRDLVRELQA